MTLRKKKGLITCEKPEFRDWFKGYLQELGFQTQSIETPFKKGFPDLIANRKNTFFLELKWLRKITHETLEKILLKEATALQKKWLEEFSTATRRRHGHQIYGVVGGYYVGDRVKTAFIQFKGNEELEFHAHFSDWIGLDVAEKREMKHGRK